MVLLVAAYFGVDLNSTSQSEPQVQATETSVEQKTAQKQAPLHREVGEEKQSTQKIEEQFTQTPDARSIAVQSDDTAKIAQAFQNRQSDVQVQATGKVVAVLKDDNEGSRHQKFILELANGQTVLVAHNIDLAPRIEAIQKGDLVEFLGEYEYSDRGGVIHWTHRDPQARHIDGWLQHNAKRYQ